MRTLINTLTNSACFRRQSGASRMPTRHFAILALLLIVVPALAGCGGEPERLSGRGRSLEVHTTQPLIVDKLAFTDNAGQHLVIRPRASNRQLVLLNIAVINRTSLVTPLLIDTEAAQLGDRRGERIDALNPFKAAKVVEAADPEENMYAPFLWGDVQLDRDFQVDGWMVFDVPKGLILGSLWWDEVDSIIVDFVEYRRRRL